MVVISRYLKKENEILFKFNINNASYLKTSVCLVYALSSNKRHSLKIKN